LDTSEGPVETLSWGVSEELLVGNSSLRLFNTQVPPIALWEAQLANTVKFAKISYDSGYVASTGSYDRLVKVWRRLSFGSDKVRFDFTYLLHPQTVTNLHWRRPFHLDQTIDNVLYTISADGVLRIWTSADPHGLQILQLWAQVDLQESIQARSLTSKDDSKLRYAFIIDGRDFMKATEYAIQEAHLTEHTRNQALDHLIEVANRSPEICVVLDEHYHMSAWGFENIGYKDRHTTNIFNISHVYGLKLNIAPDPTGFEGFVQIHNYCNQSGGHLGILVHHFDGRIELFESNLADLFDPSLRSSRVASKAVWTGHSSAIKKIVRNKSGSAVVSRTDNNESIVWKHMEGMGGTLLLRKSVITSTEYIHRICVLRKGDFVVFLHYSSISLWDCRCSPSRLVASREYAIVGKPLCVLVLPEMERRNDIAHIATISSKMKGVVWQLLIPYDSTPGDGKGSIEEFCLLDLGEAEDLAYVLPVDPAGSPPVISGFLDTFARDIAISYTRTGVLRSWTAKVDMEAHKVDWLLTCWVETGIVEPSLASGSSIRKAALVNSRRSELTIWDVRGAQLEYARDFQGQDSVRDLDWTSTPDDQSILAVGFCHRVLLLSQMRFDYLNKGPAWAPIQEINIGDLTPHPIGDSTWLGDGNLVIGAGNQLFVYDKTISVSTSAITNLRLPKHKGAEWNLFEIVTRINGPLPVFHPQFLGQCILAGKTTLVERILLLLYKALKHDECRQIDNLLGMNLEDFYIDSEVRPCR
jgi:RAVE protein 1 C terminal